MASTTTGRKGTRRPRYTDEQRAERARQDRELLDRAAATIAGDGQVIGDFVRRAVGGMSPRILGYSLRNQVLLMEQAAERGIALSDVDTFRGWRTRGRCVRKGETGLRIIRPVGQLDEASGNQDDQEPQDRAEGDQERTGRVLFRMMVVFDLSQTDGIEGEDPTERCAACGADAGEPCRPGCICPGCGDYHDASAAAEPGELLWNNLYEQITRAGYAFDWPADAADLAGARVRVDHDAHAVRVALTVTAEDVDALAEIAIAVAQILAHADRQRAEKARPQIPQQRPALPSGQVMC